MRFCTILLIICTKFISCCVDNVSNDTYHDCPIKLFRRKRDEYTRWRANSGTTQEFVVKVLDDDSTPTPKIIAVNIQSLDKQGEKIIIGGAMVSQSTTLSQSLNLPIDYTRFVPPTTDTTISDGDVYLPPVPPLPVDRTIETLKPLSTARKHAERDESPPADPQFLPRSVPPIHQYAPIVPVGFTRRTTTFAPLTPSSPNLYESSPVRTSIIRNEITRTLFDRNYWKVQPQTNYQDKEEYPTRTSVFHIPARTFPKFDVPLDNLDAEKNEMMVNKLKLYHKDLDPSYNLMLDYDDSEDKRRKDDEDTFEQKTKYGDNSIDETTTDLNESPSPRAIASGSHLPVVEITDDITQRAHSEDTLEDTTTTPDDESTSTIAMDDIVDNVTVTYNNTIRSKSSHGPCSLLKLRKLNFESPRTLPEIVAQMKNWVEVSPLAKWVDITDGNLTTMENPIYMMIIDDPSSGQIVTAKKTVMIVAGLHGRDHHAVASALYVLYQLIERSDAHSDLLAKFRFWIIPVLNPDGYDYSMTFPNRREWVKNLRQYWDTCKDRESCRTCEKSGIQCTIQPCYGVNLDRNFEYQWVPGEQVRAEHPCGSLYAGPRQLSEPETKAFTSYLRKQHTPLHTFIAFKEGDVLGIMYPYSHTKKKRAQDFVHRQRAAHAAAAAHSINGRYYVHGQTSEFLPIYAGGIEDWVDGHQGVDNTYTIMMYRTTESSPLLFITDRVVHEAFAAMDTLVLHEPHDLVNPVSLKPRAYIYNASQRTLLTLPYFYQYITLQYIFLTLVELKRFFITGE